MQESRWHAGYDALMRYMNPLQELACRRAVDTIYRQEKPLAVDEAANAIGFANPAELIDAFSRFFIVTDGGWTRPEIMADITKAKARRDRAATARRHRSPALATPAETPKPRKPARSKSAEIKPDISSKVNTEVKIDIKTDNKPDINVDIKPDISSDINPDINNSADHLAELPNFSALSLNNYLSQKGNTLTGLNNSNSGEGIFSPLRSEKMSPDQNSDLVQAQKGIAGRQTLNFDALEDLANPDVARQLWREGKQALCASGTSMANAGKVIGKFCQDFGEAEVLVALRTFLRKNAAVPLAEPVAYLRAILQKAQDQQDPELLDPCPLWCERAGFSNRWEAMNADCRPDNAHLFANGKRAA